MSDFNEKPITAEVRALVHEIVDRAMSYNSTSTRQELTGNKPTFIVRFYSHVAILDVDIYPDGYKCEGTLEFFRVHLCEEVGYRTVDDIQNKLESVIKRMEEAYDVWYEKEYTNE